jgi:hypothetical protein
MRNNNPLVAATIARAISASPLRRYIEKKSNNDDGHAAE